METCRMLPAPKVCKVEKLSAYADYWSCLVEEAAACQYVVMIGAVQICSMASKRGSWLKIKIDGKRIAVRYADSTLGVELQGNLDDLIASGRISAFRRSSGWVDIANDPIRKGTPLGQFKGLQRRACG